MLRSMYSGISGMKGFQTKLDVVGNNISNVNTSGFKKGRFTFQDLMSQTQQGAQGADGNNRGGINPMQVGLGSKTGSIDNIETQGFLQTTGRELDLAIEGDGMFIVRDGDTDYYKRAGNFYLDNDGNIVDENGYFLLDENENTIQIDEDVQSFSISKNGEVNTVVDGEPETVTTVGLAKFYNPEGLDKMGDNLHLNNGNSGEAVLTTPGNSELGTGDIAAGSLEMSNVDLAEEFTEMITAQRGFQANTRIITTSDEILQELVNLKR